MTDAMTDRRSQPDEWDRSLATVKEHHDRIVGTDPRKPTYDPVQRAKHYNLHPSGVECIQVVEHMSFCVGNAMKYLWRADHKGNDIQDLEKALYYIQREIARRKQLK